MLILAVDTSTQQGSIALLDDGTELAEVHGREETPYSERLFRDLRALKQKGNFDLKDIGLYAVSFGPGSFTGLRVGLTAVKAWAEVYGKPIAAVSGLEAIATQAAAGLSLIAPVMDARRGQVYGGLYRRGTGGSTELEQVIEDLVSSPSEYLELLRRRCGAEKPGIVSPTPEVMSAALQSHGCDGLVAARVSGVLAPMIGRIGFERAKRGAVTDALGLDANYVRRSDAEAMWKGA